MTCPCTEELSAYSDGILEAFGGKRVIFFGTTIAVPAALLGFERLCFESE